MVATDWAPVVQTGIGAVAALGGGFAAAWMQGRAAFKLERQRRREEAADALAEVTRLLEDVNPTWLRFSTGVYANEAMRPHATRRAALRVKLLRLAAGHPSRRVRRLSRQLDRMLTNLVGSSWAYLDARSDENSADDLLTAAQGHHQAAERLLGRLLGAL
jgi:hypothetical protein